MARFLTREVLKTGCCRKAKILFPAGIVVEFEDKRNRLVEGWLKRKQVERVADDTPLTDAATIKAKRTVLANTMVKRNKRPNRGFAR